MAIMLGDMTAEQVLAFILDHECYNPGGATDERSYYIEGHCANYNITATKTATGYRVLRIESE